MAHQKRNAKCSCGSEKKYKYCCLRKDWTFTSQRDVSQLIDEAGMRGLEPERSERDEAERALHVLAADPRTTKEDQLNASLHLIQLAQRRGDHNSALAQLDALVVDEHSEARLQTMFLRAISLTQVGSHNDAAALFDTLLETPTASRKSMSGFWELEAGRTYNLAGRNEDAMRMTKKALSFFDESNDVEHLTRAKSNLAFMMMDSEDAEIVKEGEALAETACDVKIALGDMEGASTNFSQLSMHHFKRENYEKAIAYGRKDLKLSRYIGDDRMLAATLLNMAMIYVEVLQLSEARAFVQEAEDLGNRLGNPDILMKCAAFKKMIEEFGRSAGNQGVLIGKRAECACKSGKKYVDCCGCADHEPVALRMPIGGTSEDIEEIRGALKATGLDLLQLDYAMRDTEQSRKRIGWYQMQGHDGWFEVFELPDMANIHLNAAKALADQAKTHESVIHEPIACAMLAVSALEAFINSTAYFAKEAAGKRSIELPPALLPDAFEYQRHTELTQKWDDLGACLCSSWPPPEPMWSNFIKLVELRNELVHYKAEGFARVAPADKHPPVPLRNLPPDVELRDTPSSWPIRLLTPSFARWSVSVADGLICYFRTNYRFAPAKLKGTPACAE